MSTVEQLRKRVDSLIPPSPTVSENLSKLSDEEVERRAREILARTPEQPDEPEEVRRARKTLSRRDAMLAREMSQNITKSHETGE